MNIIVKEPGKRAYLKSIEGTLKEMQEIVGGYLETVRIGPRQLLIVNENGKLEGLAPNFILGNDVIVGTVFVCSYDSEDFIGLNDEQAQDVKSWMNYCLEWPEGGERDEC